MLGASASGIDLGTEIASVCKTCYIFAKTWGFSKADPGASGLNMNIFKTTGTIDKVVGNKVYSGDQEFENIDVLVFCTGYQFVYPFL